MKTSPEAIAAQEKAVQALRLRKSGLQYSEIAAQLGYNSVQAAHKAVKSLLKKNACDAVEDLRRLQGEQIQELLFAIWVKATNGNLLAIDRANKLFERFARLYGLDSATKFEHTGKDGKDLPTTPTLNIIIETPAKPEGA